MQSLTSGRGEGDGSLSPKNIIIWICECVYQLMEVDVGDVTGAGVLVLKGSGAKSFLRTGSVSSYLGNVGTFGPVLWIRDLEDPGSRIRIRLKNLSIFNPKKCY